MELRAHDTPSTAVHATADHNRAARRRLDLGYVAPTNIGKDMGHQAVRRLTGGGKWFDSPQMRCFDVNTRLPLENGTLCVCLARADALTIDSRSESTRGSYRGYWCALVHFIVALQCAEVVSGDMMCTLPISVQTVLAWVGFLSAYYAPSTIEMALGAISLVHEYAGADSPTLAGRVRAALKGFKRSWDPPLKKKWLLLPIHVRAILSLVAVCCGPNCKGRPWSAPRLLRAQVAVIIGFLAFLRKSEILAMDWCDLVPNAPGYDVMVKNAKNDPEGRGRSSVIGNCEGDGTGIWEFIQRWRESIGHLVVAGCTKSRARRTHCQACGWLFPRLGFGQGQSSVPIRDAGVRVRTTVNFLASDMQQMVRQLQIDGHPDIDPTHDVRSLTGVCLRRGGNSAAAVEDVNTKIRQVQGRWVGDETADQNYMFLHRNEFVRLGATLINSNAGVVAGAAGPHAQIRPLALVTAAGAHVRGARLRTAAAVLRHPHTPDVAREGSAVLRTGARARTRVALRAGRGSFGAGSGAELPRQKKRVRLRLWRGDPPVSRRSLTF